MLHLRMLHTRRGTEDGFHIALFEEGGTYWVADTLARAFLAAGWAEVIAHASNRAPVDRLLPRARRKDIHS